MLSTRKTITAPTFGQYSNAILFTGIAATGSAASFYLNTTFGWQYGVIAAIGFGLADLGFFSISLVVRQSAGWRIRLRAMQAVFLSLSIIAAASHLMEIFEQRANEAATVAGKVERAQQAETTLRAALAQIREEGDVAALQAEHDAHSARVATETAQGGCLKKCKEAGDKAAALLPRIGAARRRDELTRSLASAQHIVTETPKQAVGGIATLAKLTGVSEEEIGSYSVAVIMGGLLLAFLLASMMAEEAGEMWAGIFARRAAHKAAKAKGAAQPAPAVEAETPGTMIASQAVSLEDEVLLKLQLMIMHAPGQQLHRSANSLAEVLGVAKSTMKEWLYKWRDEGRIAYRTTGNRTVFELPLAA
jgi:hypothetical protein